MSSLNVRDERVDALDGIESFFDHKAFESKEDLFNYMHEIKTEVDEEGQLTVKRSPSGRRRAFAKNEPIRKTTLLSDGE